MQLLTLNLQIMTKDQRLIQEIDSSLRSVAWGRITQTHRSGGLVEQEHSLVMNLNREISVPQLDKLISLLRTIRNLNCSGYIEPGQTSESCCPTAPNSGSTCGQETEGGRSVSTQRAVGTDDEGSCISFTP
jgi:hypothetical protein